MLFLSNWLSLDYEDYDEIWNKDEKGAFKRFYHKDVKERID